MRTVCALFCCVAFLAFGFVEVAAHVHESADHHEEMRGLHVGHSHLGESSGRSHHRDHAHAHEVGDDRHDAWHMAHHEGDAICLAVVAQPSKDPGLRAAPALIAVGLTVDPPASISLRRIDAPDAVRGPPHEGPIPPRAPPAA